MGNLLIHTGQADRYAADGILEETLVHEAAHTSLDAAHASAPDWLAAQTDDDEFISTYARDNPDREDIAESFLPWIAMRHRSSRIKTASKLGQPHLVAWKVIVQHALLESRHVVGPAFQDFVAGIAPWGQNIPPNRNCVAGRGLRDDQNGWFSRLQWLNGGSLGEMGKSLRSSHHRADIHFRGEA